MVPGVLCGVFALGKSAVPESLVSADAVRIIHVVPSGVGMGQSLCIFTQPSGERAAGIHSHRTMQRLRGAVFFPIADEDAVRRGGIAFCGISIVGALSG